MSPRSGRGSSECRLAEGNSASSIKGGKRVVASGVNDKQQTCMKMQPNRVDSSKECNGDVIFILQKG